MARLSDTDAAIEWLRQFDPDDQSGAVALIDSMLLVNHAEFVSRLRALVLRRAARVEGRIGLYAEREIRTYRKIPNALFKQRREKRRRRAFGRGPEPVKPTKAYDPQVGSEGLIAHLITELSREDCDKFLSHPGPDQIRRKSVRAFFLVTDFIGTGGHAELYLNAAWRVASVRSWWSYKLLRFEVLAYSGTDEGRGVLVAHPCSPVVRVVVPCPTIATEFDERRVERLRNVCVRYDPIDHDPREALGFGGSGALIAFGHGCPNNAPRILHRKGKRWSPLFPGRVTARAAAVFGDRRDDDTLTKRLTRLREKRLAQGRWLTSTNLEGRLMILLLAALRRGPRFDEALARKTSLTIPEVRALVEKASRWQWIDEKRRLTDLGFGQLIYVRALRESAPALPLEPEAPYYPNSLRPPVR